MDGIDEFLAKKSLEDMRALEKNTDEKRQTVKEVKTILPNNSKEREKEIEHLKKAIEKSEKHIEKLEKEIATIDEKLKTPEEYQKLVADPAFFTNYDSLKKQLDAEMSNWEHQTEHLQRL